MKCDFSERALEQKKKVRRQNYVWHRNDNDAYNSSFSNCDFMAENSKNDNRMEGNKIYHGMFIVSSSRDGKRENRIRIVNKGL